MAKILIATVPVLGHVRPGLPIARALVERGHRVYWYTGRKHRAAIEATGAQYLGMRACRDYDDADLNGAHPGRAQLRNLALLQHDLRALFLEPVPPQVADLTALDHEHAFDLMLNDVGFVGMREFSELTGMPFATYGMSLLPFPSRDVAPFGLALGASQSTLGRARNRVLNKLMDGVLFRGVNEHYQRIRARLGLPPTSNGSFLGAPLACQVYLQASVPGFEYPRSNLPAQVQFVGPFVPRPSENFEPPPWWDELKGSRPVVHVTQGTVEMQPERLLIPTLRALAREDVLVVATTGAKPISSLGWLPENVRVATFIDHARLLPHVDVMITNGGFGGVSAALANGVPLVCAGDTEEKPEVACLVAWSGAGVDLRTGSPSEAKLRAAVRKVLSDPSYRSNAVRLQAEIATYDAPRLACEALERLLSRASLAA